MAAARETRAHDDDSEDSDSFSSPYKGWPGIDEPMQVGRGPLRRGITDGASLLSPGRWPHSRRRFPHKLDLDQSVSSHLEIGQGMGHPRPPSQVCTLLESPFDEHEVADLNSGTRGFGTGMADEQPTGPPSRLEAFWACSGGFGGRGRRRHRVVRVERGHRRRGERRKLRLPSQRRLQEQLEAATVENVFRDKLPLSLRPTVKVVLKNQIAKKQALYMSLDAARRKLGKGIAVASLGAVRKGTNDDGTPVARVVFDGTHGVNINQATEVRDQGAAPGAPDVKRAMKDTADVQAALFGLVVDIEGRPQSGASSRGGLATPVLQSGGGCRPVRTNGRDVRRGERVLQALRDG